MLNYQAPLQDMLFVMNDVFQADHLWRSCDFPTESIDQDTLSSMLEECARFATNELSPLNCKGDEQGVRFQQGEVQTPEGFREVYALWAKSGGLSLTGEPLYGGMGMPKAFAMLVGEMLFASNQSFALYPELVGGGSHLINAYANETIKAHYLPKLYSGEWTATMCLTEAHCGSDLGLLRTKAVPQNDGSYRITGEKIFISAGEHDLSENIIHLVLARLPNSPDGVKGISLFLVPKYLADHDHCSQKNQVYCTGVEKKMGIKAAATCVMHFDEAKGYLIGKPHQGLAVMFSMMNYERLSIAMQGLGAGDASYQTALAYARERVQGKSQRLSQHKSVPIIAHGDVRRMLLTMKSLNEAGRAFAFYVATYFDKSQSHPSSSVRKAAAARLSLLTPVVKAFVTDQGFDVCVLGQQVLGGHGYIAEWGQEQYVRDVRIAQIYEGTNGIQSIDLLVRKVIADNGSALQGFLDEIQQFSSRCKGPVVNDMGVSLMESVALLQLVTQPFIQQKNDDRANACAVEYLQLFGYVSYAYMWLKMADTAQGLLESSSTQSQVFLESKIGTAQFYFKKVLPRIEGLVKSLTVDEGIVFAVDDTMF